MAERRITRSNNKLKPQALQPTIQDLFSKKKKTSSAEGDQLDDALGEPGQSSNFQADRNSAQQESIVPLPSPPTGPLIIRIPGKKHRAGTSNQLFPVFSTAKTSNSEPIPPLQQPVTIDISQEDVEPVTQEVPNPHNVGKRAGQSLTPKDGYSVDNPIVLDSSPLKSTKKPPLRPFQLRSSHDNRRKDLGGPGLEAPFPDKDFQHVRGPQGIAAPIRAELLFGRRTRTRVPTKIDTLIDTGTQFRPSISDAAKSKQIPADHIQHHPVISHMLAMAGSSKEPMSQLWVDRWSPRFAEHVLGNEFQALYLRDWLKALEIQISSAIPTTDISQGSSRQKARAGKKRGIKRSRIRREVSKTRGKKRQRIGEEDWIVSDDCISESENARNEFEDSMDLFRDPSDAYENPTPTPASEFDEGESQARPFQYPRPNFDKLSNTIVLCGPSGCGKTAAVYACAAELDWEVFEAYPGIGKRSGTSLDSLVGQVGKNHLVMKTQNTKTHHQGTVLNGGGPLSSFFSKPNQKPPDDTTSPSRPPQPSEFDVNSDDVFGFLSHSHTAETGEELNRQVRQSMILLEEADILYKDDVNFWPAVINIIKECRRPVILTCNDISLIPVEDLPIQTILYFSACSAPLVISYLQSLCVGAGLNIDPEGISKLEGLSVMPSLEEYRMSMRSDKYEADLRRCIHELQLYCLLDHEPRKWDNEDIPRGDWNRFLDLSAEWPIQEISNDKYLRYLRAVDRHMAMVSLVDSMAHVEDNASGHANSADDEVGHTIIVSELSKPTEFAFYKHDISIAQEALACSLRTFERSMLPPSNQFSTRNPEIDTARVFHRSQMMDLAHRNLNTAELSEARLFLDYEPFVRQAVYFDAREEITQISTGGRRTRNSQRSKHARWVELEEYQRERLVITGFDLK